MVGSEINKHNNLCGVFDEWFFIACEEVRQSCTIQKIELPLDTLKFCPFVAMREGVRVNAVRVDGTITEIGYGYCSIYTADGVADRIPLRNIRLDLGSIERGELEGCEIVEVGE